MGLPDLSGYSDHQLAALIIVVWLTTMGGIAALYLKTRRAGNNADAAARNAEVAVRQTTATGNGFAKSVKDSLQEIKDSISELGIELRADNARLENRLDAHMNNHDRRSN